MTRLVFYAKQVHNLVIGCPKPLSSGAFAVCCPHDLPHSPTACANKQKRMLPKKFIHMTQKTQRLLQYHLTGQVSLPLCRHNLATPARLNCRPLRTHAAMFCFHKPCGPMACRLHAAWRK
jgi:hypothetical protein